MSTVYQIKLLGPVEVTRDGRPVRGFVSRKALAMLGYLALQGQAVTRSYLAHLFWKDKSEARGRGNLSRAVSNLAKLLPGCLQADYHSVQFDHASNYELDTTAFEELLSRDDITDQATAVELYRDDLMTGLALDDCPEFETWLRMEQEQWRQRVVHLLEKLMRHHAHRHEFEQSLHFSNRLITLAPWHEEGHRQKILLLARQGQRGAALAQYGSCCRYLQKEMGVEPAAETTALIERIQAMGPGAHHNLVAQTTPFVGRAAETTRIMKLLNDPDCRLMSLVGSGGIGKTRLAIETARQVTLDKFTNYLDGVYFVSLDAVTTAEGIPITIAKALKLSLYGAHDPKVQLLRCLRDKEMLLVLDNIEQLLPEGAGLLVDILQQAPVVKIIVTSRMYLNLRWEWRFPVEGMSIPETGQIEGASAVQVFKNTARRVHLPFALSETNRSEVVRICRLVAGMPLGIELAASWAGERSCAAIGAEIERNLDFLRTSLQDISPRHRSMRAVFDYSWGFLTKEEQQVFRRLSVFRGGFQPEAAKQVAGASSRILSSLVGKSLLRLTVSGRYEMHDLLRQYAVEKLKKIAQEHQKIHDNHCAYYAKFLSQNELRQAKNQKQMLEKIDAELANIRTGWQWAIKRQRIEEIKKSVEALWGYFEIRGLFHEGNAMFGQAVVEFEKIRNDDNILPRTEIDQIIGQILLRQGWLCWRLGYYEQARQVLQRGLALLRNVGRDTQGEIVFAIYQLGVVAWYKGEYIEARKLLEESLVIGKEMGDQYHIAHCLLNLGLVAVSQGNYIEANQLHQKSLDIFQEFNEGRGILINLACLGNVACTLGEYVKAKELPRKGLAISEEMEDPFGIAYNFYQLGRLAYATKDYTEAKQLYQRSFATFEEIGERWAIALVLNHLGHTTYALGEYQEAEDRFRQALKMALEAQLIPVTLAALVGIAKFLVRDKEMKQAAELLALVLRHPASEQETKDRAEQLLAELKGQFSPQVIEAFLKKRQPRALKEVAEKILFRQT